MIWGSSFLWIKVALGGGAAGFSPLLLVTFRVAFGLAGLLTLLVAQGARLPRDGRTLRACAVVGLFNTALPFVLITWGGVVVLVGRGLGHGAGSLAGQGRDARLARHVFPASACCSASSSSRNRPTGARWPAPHSSSRASSS